MHIYFTTIATIILCNVVLLIPGLIISFIFFPLKKIDTLERIALSVALSITILPMFIFYTRLIGIPITPISILTQIIILTSICGVIVFILKKQNKFI